MIGYPAPEKMDTGKAHGSVLGDDEVAAVKRALGFDRTRRSRSPTRCRPTVVADTVNTMPEKTLPAFADHGELHPNGDAVTGTAVEAQEVFDAVAAVGADITDVFLALEDDGVDKFEQSWLQLWNTVTDQLGKVG